MKRVNQVEMYRAGSRIAELRSMHIGDLPLRWTMTVGRAANALDKFVNDNTGTAPQSSARAKELMATIGKAIGFHRTSELNEQVRDLMIEALDRFETSLEDELSRLSTFIAEPVGAYSFGALIEEASKVFPPTLRAVLPEKVLSDFTEGGACLAFDQGTACGFHVYRATDAMLRAYCAHFGAVPKGSGRDWGRYIQALYDNLALAPQAAVGTKFPNLRTVRLIDAIRSTDRNPLVHPEDDLSPDEALAAFDMCKVAVTLMAQDMGLRDPFADLAKR